ncbi:hypothetical protein KF840_05195 [bacterium]|nr:hypothetical protein [bacterium]
MAEHPRERRASTDGVRVFETRRGRAIRRLRTIGATVAVIVALVVAWRMLQPTRPHGTSPAGAGTSATASLPAAAQPAAGAAVRLTRSTRRAPTREVTPAGDAAPPAANPAPEGDADAAATGEALPEWVGELVERLRTQDGKSGIGVFPPRGTNPLKSGLIVPDDFTLPEGYVRYYQVTDDGQRLAPILMFSPDYDFVDQSGQRIDIPADGVVPPELAPPGLPLQRLALPEDPSAGGPRPR